MEVPSSGMGGVPSSLQGPVDAPMTPSWCGPWKQGAMEIAVVAISSILYVLMLLGLVYVPLSYRYWRNVEARGLKTRIAVIFLLGIYIICRIPWNAMNLFQEPAEELAAYYLNRIAISANLFAFSLVLALWMSIGHRARDVPKMPQMRFETITVVVFVVLNAILLLYSFLTIVTGPTSGPGVIAYEINIQILIITQLGMMLFFLCYGIYLSVLVRRAGKVGTTKHATPANTLMRVAGLYSFCYLLRAFAFLYRPISRCLLPSWVFWTLSYYLPEMISTIHVIWTYWKVEIRAEREREEYRKRWANGVFQQSGSRNRTGVAGGPTGLSRNAADGPTVIIPPDSIPTPDPLSPNLWVSASVWVQATKPQRASLIPGDKRQLLKEPLLDGNDNSATFQSPPSSIVEEVSPSLLEAQLAGTARALGNVYSTSPTSPGSYIPPSLDLARGSVEYSSGLPGPRGSVDEYSSGLPDPVRKESRIVSTQPLRGDLERGSVEYSTGLPEDDAVDLDSSSEERPII